MGVLFIGAMALIFYILMLRAQSLSRMEQERTDPQTEPEARVEQIVPAEPALVMHAAGPDATEVPHRLVITSSA